MKPSPSAAAFHGSFPLGSSLRHRFSRRVSLGGRNGRQDVSLGTNWHGEMAYEEFIDQDIFNTKNLTTNWGDDSPRPLVDKGRAVEPCRERSAQYLENHILPANELFLLSEYEARFDPLLAPYGDKTTNDTVDPDPMGLEGYEQQYFFDKTKNVLDQLQLGYSGYEVE